MHTQDVKIKRALRAALQVVDVSTSKCCYCFAEKGRRQHGAIWKCRERKHMVASEQSSVGI